jgi:hypothetical protein
MISINKSNLINLLQILNDNFLLSTDIKDITTNFKKLFFPT